MPPPKEEGELEQLLLQPEWSRALQESRSEATKDHLPALSHGCITVEPAVRLCSIIFSIICFDHMYFPLAKMIS